MIRLTRTANPNVLPMTLEEFKTQARVDYKAPEIFPRVSAVATAVVEAFTRRSLVTQEWTLTADCFPVSRVFILPRGPIQEVTSIDYLDEDGQSQVFGSSNYSFTADGHLYLKQGASWPTTALEVGAVTITYLAGYGDGPDSVPEELRHAVLMLATHYWDAPGAASPQEYRQVPFGISALLSPYKNPYDVQVAS